MADRSMQPGSLMTEHDVYLFKEGTHGRLFDVMGAHLFEKDKVAGCQFSVWAPNADQVTVIGDFNDWNPQSHRLFVRADGSGIWEGFLPGLNQGSRYKYRVVSKNHDYAAEKVDPFGLYAEESPATASRAWNLQYDWDDSEWMTSRHRANALNAPLSIYEVHLGSWRRVPEDANRSLSYRELAPFLAAHVNALGFTHVELMPVMEHPFYGSWGYQGTGYFAPTSRYGVPEDFMFLVDTLHRAGIGVILDWVPSHFPNDGHGLACFDGTHLFEHADPRQGFHPDWKSAIFNYGRNEVRAFLLSSALYWLDRYHIDGLRVDAVASMLYLDYGRGDGEWVPNRHGGRENLDAMSFLRMVNEAVYRDYPDTQMIAEESTAWPMVSRPIYAGGLGFGMKWNMGWMHDMLAYFRQDPIHRKYHHNLITFGIVYAFTENFVLPLSHDEVVHGKGSLIGKMPGDEWQQFANLRLLYGLMWTHPGKKLLFMGGEFGQKREWQHDESLEWHVLQYPLHAGLERWLGDLNRCYRAEPALHERDFTDQGFAWVDFHDSDNSVVSFLRFGIRRQDSVLVVCNFTPQPRHNYTVGVPRGGGWRELLNSDAPLYGGSGMGNLGHIEASPVAAQGHFHSLVLTLPPLAVLVLAPTSGKQEVPS
jgi:1,4-alpha-glucan branching enzyme